MAPKIQVRRATTAAWAAANPTLSEGEFGLDTTSMAFKIGDGATVWSSLAYKYDRGLFDIDVNGGLMPVSESESDPAYELDDNGDIMPRA